MARFGTKTSRGLVTRCAALTLVAFTVAGCKTDLYTKLDQRDANEMVALLLEKGIAASRVTVKDGSSTIQVEQSRFSQAVDVLKASGYPKQSFTNMGEVFKGGGLIASPTEERARYVFALSEELSKTISAIDGVLSARIHVVLPKNDLLKQDATPSSASVFIRHDRNAAVRTLLPQIKMLVANSIEGLNYEKVSVIFVPVDRTQIAAAAETASTRAVAASSGMTGDMVSGGAIGAAAGLAIAGGGFLLWRRRQTKARNGVVFGVLETVSSTDPSLPPPPARPASFKRAA